MRRIRQTETLNSETSLTISHRLKHKLENVKKKFKLNRSYSTYMNYRFPLSILRQFALGTNEYETRSLPLIIRKMSLVSFLGKLGAYLKLIECNLEIEKLHHQVNVCSGHYHCN